VKEAHPAVKGASGLSAPKLLTINKDISQANIVLGHPGIARDNPDYYAVTVMNYMLGGGGFASRLVKTVRDDMGLAYSIYSVFIAHKESGHFEVEVQTKNESAHIVVREIIAQMQKIRSEEVTDQELEDAKAYLTGSFPRRLETSRKIADFLTVTQFYGLEDDYLEQYPEYIKKVTKKDVLRVAQKHLCPDAYVLSVVGNLKQVKSAEFEALKDTR
jgi:zinc protease